MSAMPLIDKTKLDTNCLWKIITSKWIAKYICLGITLFISFLTGSTLYNIYYFGQFLKSRRFYIDLFIGDNFVLLWKFSPIVEGIVLIATVFGVVAILTEKRTLVKLYGIITFLAFVLNAVTGGTMVSTAIYSMAEPFFQFHELMEIYEDDLDAQSTIDRIQDERKCCGYYGPSDWNKHLKANIYKNSDDIINLTAPKSCCINIQCSSYYGKGCKETLSLTMTEIIVLVLVISSTLSILLLLGVITTFRLKKKIEEAEQIDKFSKAKIESAMQNEFKSGIEDSKKSFNDYSLQI